MLFAVNWVQRGGATEERDKRTLKLFTNWKPPAGFDFKGFYNYADGGGGVAIVEAVSAEVMLETRFRALTISAIGWTWPPNAD
mgnify:CR=1 FL=1